MTWRISLILATAISVHVDHIDHVPQHVIVVSEANCLIQIDIVDMVPQNQYPAVDISEHTR